MADDYYIDMIHRRPHHYVGADDYDIKPQHLAGHHHHHARGGGRYWGQPLFYTVDFGDVPVNVSKDDPEIPDGVQGFFGDIVHAVVSLPGDAIHTVNNVVKHAGKAVDKVGKAVGSIPIVGKPLKAGLTMSPIVASGGIVTKVLHGENIAKTVIDSAKGQIAATREVAPYVAMVASFVPGVGSGVAAAIAAGTALADGRPITDAVIAGLKNAAPGGALGKAVLGMALDVSHGNSISASAMNAALAQLPANTQTIARAAIAAAGGKNVREAVLQAVRANLPDTAKKALDIGLAVGVARNIQSHVINELVKGKLPSLPVPKEFAKLIPHEPSAAAGFKKALSLAQHSGLTAHALVAARAALPKAEQTGFDHGLKTYVNHFTKDTFGSLVRGGVVARGHWKAVPASTKGAVPGRLVLNGKVTSGHFTRV